MLGDPAQLLADCRARFGAPPRMLGPIADYARLDRAGAKMLTDTRFAPLTETHGGLLVRGEVVWAHMVQANSHIYSTEACDDDHWGVAVYSVDPRAQRDLGPLVRAARACGAARGKRVADPALQRIADVLADEMTVEWRLPVPPALTDGVACIYTSIWLQRRHLPGRILGGPILPLLVRPDFTEATMVLPERFWAPGIWEGPRPAAAPAANASPGPRHG